jgi:hypothetical protein
MAKIPRKWRQMTSSILLTVCTFRIVYYLWFSVLEYYWTIRTPSQYSQHWSCANNDSTELRTRLIMYHSIILQCENAARITRQNLPFDYGRGWFRIAILLSCPYLCLNITSPPWRWGDYSDIHMKRLREPFLVSPHEFSIAILDIWI